MLTAQFRELRRVAPPAYWLVWWGTLINRIGTFVVVMLAIYLRRERGLSAGEAGTIASLFGLGQIGASLVGGQLADRWGRRATMVTSLLGGAAGLFALGQARDTTTIAALVLAVGFVGELYRPAVAALIADVVPPTHRVAAYSLLHWVVNIGFAIAAAVGGALADIDFALLFVIDALTMAGYGVLVWVAVPETRPAAPRERAAQSPSWIFDRDLVVFVVIVFALTAVVVQTGPVLSVHMLSQQLTSTDYGLVMAANGALIVAFQPMITQIATRRDPQRVLAIGAALTTLGVGLHGAASGLAMHFAAVATWTLGEILESPMRSTIVAALAPSDARGRYQGALVTAWGSALFVGNNVGPRVWEDIGPSALWIGCVVVGGIAIAALIASAPQRRARIATCQFPSESS